MEFQKYANKANKTYKPGNSQSLLAVKDFT